MYWNILMSGNVIIKFWKCIICGREGLTLIITGFPGSLKQYVVESAVWS